MSANEPYIPDTPHLHPMWFVTNVTARSQLIAQYPYGVATISRLLTIIGLFCKRALWKRLYSAKETYNLKEPTNRSHPIHTGSLCMSFASIKILDADCFSWINVHGLLSWIHIHGLVGHSSCKVSSRGYQILFFSMNKCPWSLCTNVYTWSLFKN